MDIKLIKWQVFDEIDFIEDETDKIKCTIVLTLGIYNTDGSVVTEFTRSMECVYLNSMTGYEMDKARLDEVETIMTAYDTADKTDIEDVEKNIE